jgi:AcrR family transcriptional regulator
MNSNKSRPSSRLIALKPQRSHGKRRVAALLEAGASVIAEKGFQAATMAEIASRAGAPIGSLYRFFPNKEILADALLQRFVELVDTMFDDINRQIGSLSTAALTDALLRIVADLHGQGAAIRALLQAHSDWSTRRQEFRSRMRRHIAETLTLRSPKVDPEIARNMAAIILQNMKMVGVLREELRGAALVGALTELREMTRLYLATNLRDKSS